MRTLSSAVQTTISTNLGVEPVNIIEVQWSDSNGDWSKYADKDVTDFEFPVSGKIISISNLESVVKLDSQGQSQSLSVVLSDTEGDLKDVFNNNDIHGKSCKFYQWFDGLPLSERFVLYEGEINSPITWKEGDRTLSFEVITKLADSEIGFSPEEGKFEFLPDDIVGKAWPLIFGTVQNVPCTLLSEIPRTETAIDSGLEDPSIAERLKELQAIINNSATVAILYLMAAGASFLQGNLAELNAEAAGTEEEARFWYAEASRLESLGNQYQDVGNQALINYQNAIAEQNKLRDTLADQEDEAPREITLTDGSHLPQGVELEFEIGDLNATGSVSGNILTVHNIQHPDYEYDGTPFGFTYNQAGTSVKITSAQPILYIVSITDFTISTVKAYKQVGNNQVLTIVPDDSYTVVQAAMGPYTVTYLKLDSPLSIVDEDFSDDIYVTGTATLGPNTADILQWLVETYTDWTVDATSFAAANIALENYPSHFALTERKNILTAIEEIAFQARCAVWVSNNVVYIKYLSEDQTEVDTFTEADIDAGSLVITTTPTEELVTKLVAEWTDDYTLETKHSITIRNNGSRYGIRERVMDFYIYNIGELVVKSATFWLIRMSNVWKDISFDTYINKLALESFDAVKFDFVTNHIADSDVIGEISQTTYNLDSQTISIEARVPVRFGEMEEYPFYNPKSISVDFVFPTLEAIVDGSAGSGGVGEDVEGPLEIEEEFATLTGSYQSVSTYRSNEGLDYQRRYFRNEITPTDVDDVKPSVKFNTKSLSSGDEPVYDYNYGAYLLDIVEEPPADDPPDLSYSVPGRVFAPTETPIGGTGVDYYTTDVYLRGLDKDPTPLSVKQLQISSAEVIPEGTWVMVGYNKWTQTNEDGTTEQREEYTMEVPVWL